MFCPAATAVTSYQALHDALLKGTLCPQSLIGLEESPWLEFKQLGPNLESFLLTLLPDITGIANSGISGAIVFPIKTDKDLFRNRETASTILPDPLPSELGQRINSIITDRIYPYLSIRLDSVTCRNCYQSIYAITVPKQDCDLFSVRVNSRDTDIAKPALGYYVRHGATTVAMTPEQVISKIVQSKR